MKGLFKKLRFWIILGFIISLVIIVIVGYLYNWSMEVRVLSIIILVFLLIFIFMLMSLRAARKARKVEQQVKAQTYSDKLPERQREIDDFKKKMQSAIQSLKKSQLSKNKKGKSNLYSLPWYMFIGSENSGKTTIIDRSGLNFPFGIESGLTKNCDWFFSNSSILIDTAGKLIKEEDQGLARGEWYALLEMLCKYRKRQPLNGIVICVDLIDLVNANTDKVESMAKALRNRVNDLVQYTGFHLPLYLVFTKCDLLEGFDEFFNEMTENELGQVWGYTLPKKQQINVEMDKLFEKEFKNLYKTLSLFRLNKLSFSRSIEKQNKIYNFPERFYTFKEVLNKFVGKLFQTNFYADNPVFRGFYFTSATQTQLSTQRASEEIEMQFNPETHISKAKKAGVAPRIYFVHDLFSRLIIPEQFLIKPTSRMKFRTHFRNIALSLAMLILLSFFTLNVVKNTSQNIHKINTLTTIMNAVNQVDWNQKLQPSHFELLNELHSFTIHVQDNPLLGGSIYQGKRLIAPVNRLYIKKFTPFVSIYLFRDMLSRNLQDYMNKTANISRDNAYEYLRGYLLLDTHINLLSEEKAEREFLKNLMAALVDSLLEQKFNMAYQNTFNDKNITLLRSTLHSDVNNFVEILSSEKTEELELPFKNDTRLVAGVRRVLGKPDVLDIYARIKREGMVQFKPVSINQIMSKYAGDIFEANASIPEFFTKNAWEKYVKQEIENSCRNPNRDDWVLNVEASELPAEFKDAALMEQKLKQRYFQDYARAWWKFLGQIRYKPFRNANNAAEQLSLLGDFIDSPLRKLLDIVSTQTKFEGLIDQKAQKLKKDLGFEAKSHSIDEQFRFVHALSEDEGGKLAELLGQFEALAGLMEALSEDPGENSVKSASTVLKQGSGEIPDALQSIRRSLRRFDKNAREGIFEEPVLMTWAVLLEKSQQYLSQQWYDQIYQPFETHFTNQYPINRNSNTDTPPADLAEFFKKNNGTFWAFVTNELDPFLKTKSWNPKNWEGHGIQLSENFKATLQKASEITEGLGLMNQDNLKIDFKILPQLPESKIGNVDQIKLYIDGQELVYRMGRPAWQSFFWPNPANVSSARLEVHTRIGNYRPQQFDGSWSLFKLLDQAIIQKTTASEFNVEWRFPPDQNYEIQVKFKIRATSVNNPFGQKNFFNISLPKSLYNID